jgi:hypothetical protein
VARHVPSSPARTGFLLHADGNLRSNLLRSALRTGARVIDEYAEKTDNGAPHLAHRGADIPETQRSYVPVTDPALDMMKNLERDARIDCRAKTGAPVAPEELPYAHEYDSAGRQTKPGIAIWNSAYDHVRDGVTEVMLAFVLGATVLRPIKIALVDNKGVDTRFLILLTSNILPTTHPDRSKPIRPGWLERPRPIRNGPVHQKVQARRSALEGPALWTDPGLADTLFVNDALAQALLSEPFGRDLHLKQVRLAPV